MDEPDIEEGLENAIQTIKNVWFTLGVFHGMNADSMEDVNDLLEENEDLHDNYLKALDFLENIIDNEIN